MKDLVISSAILFFLFVSWTGFLSFSSQEIDSLTWDIQKKILPSIETEDWTDALQMTQDLQQRWKTLCQISLFFRDSAPLNEIDISLARTSEYVRAEDRSNSAGELQSVCRQLKLLQQQEKLSLQNIF